MTIDRKSAMTAMAALAPAVRAVKEWDKFLSKAKTERIEPEQFAAFVPLLFAKIYIPRTYLADLLLRPTKKDKYTMQMPVLLYLQVLLDQKLVDLSSVLKALYRCSTLHKYSPTGTTAGAGEGNGDQQQGPEQQKKQKPTPIRWEMNCSKEECIFRRLERLISQGNGIKNARAAIDVGKGMIHWMALFSGAAAAFSRDAFGAIHSVRAKIEMEDSRTAFSMLLLSVCENNFVLSVLSKQSARVLRKQLSKSLDSFIASMMQSQPDIAGRLELFRGQTLASFEPADKKKDAAVSDMSSYMDNLIGLDNFQVPEIPIVNSRAGLYIYLNAALVGRPMVDDSALYTYLHNRYQGDLQTTAIQLVLASFDVLANAIFRNESNKTGHLLKSYLVNKVPLILGSFAASSGMYAAFNAEFCITEALGQVDTNVFPTLSGMFDMPNTNSTLQESVRQDFCFACQLHGLLSQTAIESLLGDITYQSLPDEGRYVKETLVQQCLEDAERTQKLIGELDNMNGNVGAAAQAITEVIGTLCRNKETMTLKQLCSQLASKPLSLDILLLFDKPLKILHPLCELLDNWKYDEDQGEYQPVYEEFGSILLLLLAFVYRYNLTPTDLGIRSSDSFVGKLLSTGHLSRPLDELNEQDKSHLGGWIQGLFGTEGGGLGDELMSSCPPQDFYLLMPTLFHQVVGALTNGGLTEDMLKGGFEYLVDILLLPSLVPAILCLSNHLRTERPQCQSAILKVFQLILLPNSISNEASTMLSSVLNIVANPLENALRSYQRQDPKSQEVEPLLRALKENLLLSRRTGGADHNELESWTSTHGGGLSAAVRHTMQNFNQWAQQPTLNTVPTAYTHRQILAALKMLGARHLLTIIIEELRTQTEAGHGSIAYDVATALVCAPDVTNDASLNAAASLPDETGAFPPQQQRRITLREALKAEAEDWKKLQKTDPALAETVVRLYRRVEAQMALPPPVVPQQVNIFGQAQDDLGAALGVGVGVGVGDDALGDAMMAAAAAAAGDHAGMDAMSLDTSGLPPLDTSGVDLGGLGGGAGDHLGGMSATNSVGGTLDLNDDIFSGLPTGDFNADFGSWDDMNLG
ncbi:mediator complex, subunit Med5 [Diplogelasinospora grovesii]|uniref:Mediator of RNA polymerase II transcription subunit 5 n=1 Tax=Diplogelasinospora grovesii TaxID=303347 RepID=A0AAN6S5M9_9PEZI|nr:mediator complex, subunit Med5 [Diplogelasinospora grovesii]